MADSIVTTSADETVDPDDFTIGFVDGAGTGLREAIALANATPGEDRILFDTAVSGSVFRLGLGEIQITESIIIDGGGGLGAPGLTISGDAFDDDVTTPQGFTVLDMTPPINLFDNCRIFLGFPGTDVRLEGLALTGGVASDIANLGARREPRARSRSSTAG